MPPPFVYILSNAANNALHAADHAAGHAAGHAVQNHVLKIMYPDWACPSHVVKYQMYQNIVYSGCVSRFFAGFSGFNFALFCVIFGFWFRTCFCGGFVRISRFFAGFSGFPMLFRWIFGFRVYTIYCIILR